jgi:hypothetical protein
MVFTPLATKSRHMKTTCITILIYFLNIGMSNGQTFKMHYGRDWSILKWYIQDEYTDYTETLKGNVFYLGIDFLNKKYFNLNIY